MSKCGHVHVLVAVTMKYAMSLAVDADSCDDHAANISQTMHSGLQIRLQV